MRHTRTVVAIGLAVMVFWAGRAGSVLAQQAPQVQSITLEEALATALRRNLTLRVAAFEVRVAETQLVQATAAKSGQINATAAYSRTRQQDPMVVPVSPGPGSVTLPTPDVNQYQAGVALQLPLYTGGRLESQAALAEANLRGAQAALERIRQQIVLEVKQAYYRLLLARAGERAAERVLARAQENHRLARARVEAGTVPRFDALQAETSVASADLGVVRVQNDVALARQSLAALLYLPLTTPLEPKEELTFALAPRDLTVDSLIARALQARPELAELRAQTAVATAAVAVARSGLLPHLFLTAMYGGMGGPSFTETWSAGLMVTLLVFDGGVTQARIREAEARLEQLKAREADVRQAVELEVRQAFLATRTAEAQVVAARKIVEQATETLRLSNVRYEGGVTTGLEVVSAQATFAQGELDLVQALFQYNVALARLERAVGAAVR